MPDEYIQAELARIIRDALDDKNFVVKPETSAKDHPDWDSFNHINIIVGVEMRFGVKFRTSEIECAQTVGDLARLIAQKPHAA